VGLSEQEARRQGYTVSVASLSMANVARVIETGEPRGLMKAVVDSKSHQILGAAIVRGRRRNYVRFAGGNHGKAAIRRTAERSVCPPTFAESLNNLFVTIDQ
jgi:pyruvate/2-oxoglutarate dehydrogenase complex dihydrolipoamide dehydrogenase (E3) component